MLFIRYEKIDDNNLIKIFFIKMTGTDRTKIIFSYLSILPKEIINIITKFEYNLEGKINLSIYGDSYGYVDNFISSVLILNNGNIVISYDDIIIIYDQKTGNILETLTSKKYIIDIKVIKYNII